MGNPLKTVTVTGILYPQFNEDSGDVVGAILAAYDDTEYELESDHHMDGLIALCQQEVTVTGRIRFAKATRILSVNEFESSERGPHPDESLGDPSFRFLEPMHGSCGND